MQAGKLDRVIDDHNCFCCGLENERGLKLVFEHDSLGAAEANLVIPEWFSGWKRMTHGGLLSMLLDEGMAHACISVLSHAVTAELTVRYRNPVEVGERIIIQGKIEKTRARIIETSGTITDSSGIVIATGTARFLRITDPSD